MRVLITGVTGFIGSHVLGTLKSSEHTLALLVRNIKESLHLKMTNTILLEGSFDNFEAAKGNIKKFDPQICIHLAWQGIPDYSAAISKQNLYQSIELIDFLSMETECKKIIISGSCLEYGKIQGECIESENIRTTSFFAWAKQSLYNYASLLCAKSSINLIWFRIFYVYGPGQRPSALIPYLVHSFLKGERPIIQNPFNSNDFIYIEDVINAIKLALESNVASGIYNLGSGKTNTILDVCRIVEQQISNSNDFTEYLAKQYISQEHICFWANIEKAREILGWKPRYELEMGVQQYTQLLQGLHQKC